MNMENNQSDRRSTDYISSQMELKGGIIRENAGILKTKSKKNQNQAVLKIRNLTRNVFREINARIINIPKLISLPLKENSKNQK